MWTDLGLGIVTFVCKSDSWEYNLHLWWVIIHIIRMLIIHGPRHMTCIYNDDQQLPGEPAAQVIADVLHTCSVKLLTKLFNICLETSLIPSPWTHAIMNPISRCSSNDKLIPLNYQGISLLSTTSKLITGPWLADLKAFWKRIKFSWISRRVSSQIDPAWIIYLHWMI